MSSGGSGDGPVLGTDEQNTIGLVGGNDPLFSPSSGGSGLFGVSGGDYKKIADALGGLKTDTSKSQSGTPQQQRQQLAQEIARAQGGGLNALLQLLNQRANMYFEAARQGTVPPPTRNQGGLLGM
jgi:hypothetical protein